MNRTASLLAIALLAGVAHAQQVDVPLDSELVAEEEELRRYSVEVILFTYDASVTTGTEVFAPDPPPLLEIEDALPIDDPFGIDAAAAPPAFDSGPSLAEPAADGLAANGYPDNTDPDDAAIPEYGDTLPLPGDEPLDPALLEDMPLVDLIAADTIELELIPQEELALVDTHERLLLLDAYQPVLWAGWTQLVRPEEETPVIRLRRLGPVPLEMSGTLKLYLSRFLHLVADLDLEAPGAPLADPVYGDVRGFDSQYDARYGSGFGFLREDSAPIIHYRIREDRIVNSGDLRYFDHPKFGLLAKLARVEAEEVDEAELLPGEPPSISDDADNTDDLLPR